jgi:hypothetical protein
VNQAVALGGLVGMSLSPILFLTHRVKALLILTHRTNAQHTFEIARAFAPDFGSLTKTAKPA